MTKDQADYDLEIARLVEEIRRRGCGVVGIQLPDGLKRYTDTIKRAIETQTEAIPVFCSEPCFGACDVSETLPDVGCDMIVHIGHSRMVQGERVPVIYVPCFSNLSVEETLKKNIGMIAEKTLGLVASLQHVKDIPGIKRMLTENGFEVKVGGPGSRTEYPGQVLGCNYEAARDVGDQVEAFVHIGGGNFHPLGVALTTGKKVYVIDPYIGEVREVGNLRKKVLQKRFAKIEGARNAKRFGLLVSTKPGQRRMNEAARYRKLLMREGIDSTILTYDRLDPSRLVSYDLDAYVNFGCPRMAIEDSELFPKPVLTPQELDILLGHRPWEDYVLDEIA